MRKTRFMSLLFLVWSIAFFFVPDFRQALQGPLMQLSLAHSSDWLERASKIPHPTLAEAVRTGEERRDARSLAFAAMHSPSGGQECMRLAAEAVTIDPGLTWIYSKIFANLGPDDRRNPNFTPMLKLLEAWDPDNAFPYLLEGGQMVDDRHGNFPPSSRLDDLAKETEWRSVMEKAFAAARYDSYKQREFDLDRTWLREHNLAKPETLLFMVAAYPIPSFINIRMYTDLLIRKLGKDAETAGHTPEALRAYWAAAHLGERMQLDGSSLIERLMGLAVEKDAHDQLIPLLRRTGQADQAASLEYTLQQSRESLDALRGKDPLARSVNYNWTALIMGIYVAWVAGLSLLTALCMGYVNVKRWVRREETGRLYNFVTVAENYLPVLLFFACLGLYLTYYPYAQNFHQYVSAVGATHDLEPLFHNTLPSIGLIPANATLPIGNPLMPYAWYAIAGIAIIAIVGIPFRRRAKR